jgi:hypothetical protein
MKKYKRKYNTPEYRKKYTGIYGSWYALRQRCNNPNNASYSSYGGRGITYPKKWETFKGFCEDMKEGYKKGFSIDRIDNNGSYSKENCRWVTRKIQNNNKRSNIVLTYKGKTLPLALWAEVIGLPFDRIRTRWYRGWSVERILYPKKLHRYVKA